MLYKDLTKEELLEKKEELQKIYDDFKAEGHRLNISRGVPSKAQLALSMGMLDVLHSEAEYMSENGIDTRNYGCLDGLPEAKRLMSDVMETKPDNVIIFCDSSLNIMYDLISKSYTHGVMGSTPWCKLPEVKFLCPVPGYDRHFAITEYFGIQMINIPMTDEGPDMDLVEKYVSEDEAVKGIWCVPKYSNPTGTVYSDETVYRFARLKPKAKDFRIYWDNAYNVHHLDMNHPNIIPELIEECRKAGNPDMVYKFGSFSKISFSGSSIAALATSPNNIEDVKAQMKVQTIGHNKINQLRHVLFFKNAQGVMAHMAKHAMLLKPKFDLVEEILRKELAGTGLATWSDPQGGYFICMQTMPGLAKKVISMMKECGIVMTEAGAPYPYHKDPEDSCIRIAPSSATEEDLRSAIYMLSVVVKLCGAEALL